jgi:NAD(P)-dependent dehydrogenase (short-subunit alcohol dehydrogenase family)
VSEFSGKVALVTGAGSGIGRASAQLFAAKGASVLVCDISEKGGAETVSLIQEAGGIAAFEHCDVTDVAAVNAAVAHAVSGFGGLDYAHNNAGAPGVPSLIHEVTDETWHLVVNVTLTGIFNCMRAELAHMVAERRGAIVNTASTAGAGAAPLMPAYTAAKHGVVGLTRSGADYAKRGVRVNAVSPGATRTPMLLDWINGDPATEAMQNSAQPINRMASPEEIAQVAVWLCSDSASYVTGAIVMADGGMTAVSGGGALDT